MSLKMGNDQNWEMISTMGKDWNGKWFQKREMQMVKSGKWAWKWEMIKARKWFQRWEKTEMGNDFKNGKCKWLKTGNGLEDGKWSKLGNDFKDRKRLKWEIFLKMGNANG